MEGEGDSVNRGPIGSTGDKVTPESPRSLGKIKPSGEVVQTNPMEVRVMPEQVEEILNKMDQNMRDALGVKAGNFIDALQTEFAVNAADVGVFKDFVQESLTSLRAQAGQPDNDIPQELLDRNTQAIADVARAMGYYGRQQEEYNYLLQGQTSQYLRTPTPQELLAQTGGFSDDERQYLLDNNLIIEVRTVDPETGTELPGYRVTGNIYREEFYQKKVEGWFEDRLRHMETFDLAFEEQPDAYNAVVRAETFFKFRDETRPLAERLHRRIEDRRIKQRMVRVWSLTPPDQLMGEAGKLTTDVLKGLFTYEDNGDRPIEREFQNYERLGLELLEERVRLKPLIERAEAAGDDARQRELEDQYSGRKIKDYYEHGGRVEVDGEEVFVDQAIAALQEKKARRPIDPDDPREPFTQEDADRLKELQDIFWARRSAGGLWSITSRAGHFDVIINGTGDFFDGRIKHLADKLEGRGFAMKTKGIWRPEVGKYAGQDLDLEFDDFFTGAIGKFGNGWHGIQMEDGVITSLAEANIGDRAFWEELDTGGVPKAQYVADFTDKFIKADLTRKFFWEADSFLDDPDIQKFIEIKTVFKHIKEKNRPQKWRELTERYLEWMCHDPKAPELQEELMVAPAGQKNILIEQASERELISNEVRDELLSEYLPFRFPFPRTIRGKAGARVLVDTLYGVLWRYKPTRNKVLMDWLMELIKQSFKQMLEGEFSR